MIFFFQKENLQIFLGFSILGREKKVNIENLRKNLLNLNLLKETFFKYIKLSLNLNLNKFVEKKIYYIYIYIYISQNLSASPLKIVQIQSEVRFELLGVLS